MFEQVVVRPRRRTLKTVAIVGSAIAHAGAVAALIVVTMWHVDKVAVGPIRDDLVVRSPRMAAAGSEARSAQRLKVERKPDKIKVTVVTQPTPTPTPAPTTTSTTTTTTTGPGTGPDTGLTPIDGEPCTGDDCGEGCPPGQICDADPVIEPPIDAGVPVDAPRPPPIVDPKKAGGLRIGGDDQVRPSQATQLALLRAGKEEMRGTFQLCVGTDGEVYSVRRLASTGFAEYDAALEQAIWGWRYRAYELDGRPTPMCTVATFVYRIAR